jgi:exodeoxyribonuclease VII small subunit
MPAKNPKDYQTLSAELEEVLLTLQQPGLAVDNAVKLYEKGTKIVAELEKYITEAEHNLEKMQLRVEPDAQDQN